MEPVRKENKDYFMFHIINEKDMRSNYLKKIRL